jgi:hypothetical protein
VECFSFSKDFLQGYFSYNMANGTESAGLCAMRIDLQSQWQPLSDMEVDAGTGQWL